MKRFDIVSTLLKTLRTYSFRGSGITFIIQILSAILAFLGHMLLARWLDLHSYGKFVYYNSFVLILSIFATCGLPLAAAKFIPEYQEHKKHSLLSLFIGKSYFWIIISSILLYIFSCTLLYSFGEPGIYWAVFSAIPIFALIYHQMYIFRVLKKMLHAQIPMNIIKNLGIIISAFLIFNFTNINKFEYIFLGLAILLSPVILFQGIQIFKTFKASLDNNRHSVQKNWLKISFGLLGGFVLYELFPQLDILVLGNILEKSVVGKYNAIFRIANVVEFVYYSTSAVVLPILAKNIANNDKKEISKYVRRANFSSFFVGIILAIFLFSLHNEILKLFGTDFTNQSQELFILMLSQVLFLAFGFSASLLMVSGYQNLYLKIMLFFLIIKLICLYLFIPKYGIIAACYINLFLKSSMFLVMSIFVCLKLKIRSFIF